MTTYVTTGFSSTSTGFVYRLKEFVSVRPGWSINRVNSDTPLSRDYVFSSTASGTTLSGLPTGGPFCVRITATGSSVGLYGYETCVETPSGIEYSGEIHDATYSNVYWPSGTVKYWIFADNQHIKFVLRDFSNSYYYHGYLGLLDGAYNGDSDLYPILVFGTSNSTQHWEDTSSTVMSDPTHAARSYSAWVSTNLQYANTTRASLCGGVKPIIFCSGTEVRGTPKGVYKIQSAYAGDGIEYKTSDGFYYAFLRTGASNNAYLYGPAQP